MVKVLWRFLGYITSTQSGFSMNRWVHGQGTVEVFRYITSTQSGFFMNRWVHGQGTVEV